MHIKNLSNKHKARYNFCLIIDVLHHIGLEKNIKIHNIAKKLKKISKIPNTTQQKTHSFFKK